jgi:hypothetical protein
MNGGEVKHVREYFQAFVDAEPELHFLLYGDVRHRLDVDAGTVKRYPIMTMDQPTVKTKTSGSTWYNHYKMGIGIVERVKDESLKTHVSASDACFTLMGRLIKQLIADQRNNNFTHLPLVFEMDEVDTNLIASHVGWRVEFDLMLVCGSWIR